MAQPEGVVTRGRVVCCQKLVPGVSESETSSDKTACGPVCAPYFPDNGLSTRSNGKPDNDDPRHAESLCVIATAQ